MRFRFLVGDMNWETYGGSFVSKRLNNGEFDYWLVLEVIPSENEEANPRYQVSLNVVAPSQCPLAEQQAAVRSWRMIWLPYALAIGHRWLGAMATSIDRCTTNWHRGTREIAKLVAMGTRWLDGLRCAPLDR